MTDAEKLTVIKTLLSDGGVVPSDEKLNTYIQIAGQEILAWKYHLVGGVPEEVTDVSAAEDVTHIYAVVAGYTHAGSEGEKQHNENSVNRVFVYADMVDYIRNNVLPYVRVGAVT